VTTVKQDGMIDSCITAEWQCNVDDPTALSMNDLQQTTDVTTYRLTHEKRYDVCI